jgi:protein-L-isoaspartate(D-aspartate) O-methyltransferase
MIDYAAARTAMVDRQVRTSDVTSYPIIDAMLSVPRERFAPPALRAVAYAGEHLALAPGRVMLDPRTFAKMIDAADPGPDDLVLDVGCGLGYSTAVLARMAAAVVAVEADEAMARSAAATLTELEVDNAEVLAAPLAGGAAAHAPYNVILVEGGVEEVPEGLREQLREGGRMVFVRMEGEYGWCELVTRVDGAFARRRMFDAAAPVLPGFERQAAFEF